MLAKAYTINPCSKFPSQPTNFFILSLLLASSSLLICAVKDTIRVADTFSYANGDNLTSAGKKFVLGFFSPSPGRLYLGIWYFMDSMDSKTVVWVANRNKPLPDNGVGFLAVSRYGNLELLDNKNNSYFSTGLEGVKPARWTAMLLDSGNLVLRDEDDESGSFVWQSFKHPTDTFLPGMKMSEGMKLTSWTSVNDPKTGKFTFQQDEDEETENNYSILEGDICCKWKTGQTDSSKLLDPVAQLLYNFSEYVIKTKDGSYYNSKSVRYLNYSYLNKNVSWENTRLVMNSSGAIEFYSYQSQWDLIWSEPRDNCSVYRVCGSFGRCNISRNGIEMCSCLPGFEPNLPETWDAGHFSGGCKRTSTLCGKEERVDEILVNLTKIRVSKPDSRIYVESEEKCREACRDCDCQAYSYSDANNSRIEDEDRTSLHRCWTWTDLYNLGEDYFDGYNLSVRVVASDLGTFWSSITRYI